MEQTTQTRGKQTMSDLISRQQVIDVIWNTEQHDVKSTAAYNRRLKQLVKIINAVAELPSAQPEFAKDIDVRDKDCISRQAEPEPLTDREQRIFLAAMGREEKVCKQVDDELRNCREPYEDSLVRTCHEIIRKVKDALWT